MRFLIAVGTIVRKDVIAELRTRELLVSMLLFALLILVILNFAFSSSPQVMRAAAPGILWVTFTFAGVLGLSRSFLAEHESGCLEGIIIAPIDREAIYLGKMLANLLFMAIAEAVVLPIFSLLYNFPIVPQLGGLVVICLLGTIGFAAAGTLLSAMAANSRMREVLLPIVLFPIAVPVIVSSVKMTGVVLSGHPLATVVPWLRLLIAYDTIFLVIAMLTFGYLVEE